MTLLEQAVIFLGAAVAAVPLFRRLGLGSVLGYLVAGVLLGPHAFQLFTDVDSILHFAEFGVVLLLFIIGLELQPSRLWTMRGPVFGLGGLQVSITAAVLALTVKLLGLDWTASMVLGLTLAASSTALVLQLMAENRELASPHGRSAFAVVLFQDLVAIPLIAVVPFLGGNGGAVAPEDLWPAIATAAGALAVLLIVGRYVLRAVLRVVAKAELQEVFTALTLFTVVGSALLLEAAGLSMALGAFLAGVLLAENEYRHELEANIEPFKGLLLGLFFIAVGMSINLDLLVSQPIDVLALVLALVLIKAGLLTGLGQIWGLPFRSARRLGLLLGQSGEFGFVILTLAFSSGVIDIATLDMAILVVGLSMAATPILSAIQLRSRQIRQAAAATSFDHPDEEEPEIIIAGGGRFGQIVARVLRARNIRFTVLDPDPDQVQLARKFGSKVYYGDPARLDVLRAARADKAKHFVLAIGEPDHSLRVAEQVRKHFPQMTIYARARSRQHVYRLWDLGIKALQRDTLLSAMDLTRQLLEGMGFEAEQAQALLDQFREHDEKALTQSHAVYRDEDQVIQTVKQTAEELTDLLADDAIALRRSRARASER